MTSEGDETPREPAAEGGTYKALLDAAEACFADYSVAKTSMGDVAARAGVSRPTLYRYFADRETLSVEVVMRRSQRLIARAQAHLARYRRFSDQLVEGLLFLVDHGRRDQIVMELITDGRPARATERLANSETAQRITREVWRPVLERARQRGELRSDLNLDDAFTWLVYVQVVMIAASGPLDGPQEQESARRMMSTFVLPAFVAPPVVVDRIS